MCRSAPTISGNMNALRLPTFFEALRHSHVIFTAGDGSFGHESGHEQEATSRRQAEEVWMLWRAGAYGDI
eukprot:7604529-Alexandrium_andersonii.AAC.1